MARKRHTAEEIVAKLRQVDVLMGQGRQVDLPPLKWFSLKYVFRMVGAAPFCGPDSMQFPRHATATALSLRS